MQKFHDEVEVTSRDSALFGVDKDSLSELFEPDNIKDGVSMKTLKNWGGTEGILNHLKVDLSQGLNSNNTSDMMDRGQAFGRNAQIAKPTKSFCKFCWEAFDDLMLKIITCAAIISTVIGTIQHPDHGWMEGVTILAAVGIIVGVTAGNNYMKEKQFEKLYKKSEDKQIEVTRDGKRQQISVFDLMVGDLNMINIGDMLPVDGILVQSSEILMDESSITGESDLIKKNVPKDYSKGNKSTPFMISGSKCMDGSGIMLVAAVGVNTQNGKLKLRLQEEAPQTPLQIKLDNVAADIGKIGLFIALLTIIALMIHMFVAWGQETMCIVCFETSQFIVNAILTCVAIIVMAVPEGLPLAITITLAYSVGKMKDENNLVRELQSCEIMGGANNICSDKTGTLTQNKMSVTNLYMMENEYTRQNFDSGKLGKENVDILGEGLCVNSTAIPKKNADGSFEQLGNKTECALVELADHFGFYYEKYRPSEKIAKVIPFSSARKRMFTAYRKSENTYRIYCKGAPEMIIDGCTNYIGKNGVNTLDEKLKEHILNNQLISFAKKSLRTILVAYKEVTVKSTAEIMDMTEDQMAEGLTLICITGIKDPLRPEIVDAVKKCKRAGITVRMVTGDNYNTAIAIAKECGILKSDYDPESANYEAMEGKKFREMVGGLVTETVPGKDEPVTRIGNFDKFQEIAAQLKVMARCSPDDKYTLVTGLIQMENVVAVTGDGTNDAPALKKADVGFAMGIAGTDVAKEAAGIILLDDNFNSIVCACKWGRNIYDCIRKFIQFQLSINIVALSMAFIGAVSISESPLNPIQILWVNLIMDTFAALALATEPPTEELLKRLPYSRNEYIVTPVMWRGIFGQSVYQMVILCLLLFFGPQWLNIESGVGNNPWDPSKGTHFTMFFHIFVLCQLVNEINCRKLKMEEKNVFAEACNNPFFWVIELLQILVQIAIVEFGGQFVKCCPLTWEQHGICIALSLGAIIVGVIVKLVPECLYQQCSVFRDITDWEKLDEIKTPLRI